MNTHSKDIHTHTHTLPGPIKSGPEFGLDIPIFAKLYDFYESLNQFLTLFPKSKRYTLGQKIDQMVLDTIELVITAGYLPREQKLPVLKKASIKIDLLKILLRISWKTKCLDHNKYQNSSAQLIEIGRMLGGWIKTLKQ